ncbi:hypothetical protein NDU88_005826 [Pleurodeles waltl]|uniref:Uncharacterized protein n=1 Tax=Pleurodeles waltl TaxID=8319 RepID=A0AAV7UL89_PLEWA|nr:hypothetical protein NDU88_005826 [Pleurodeles waltl]
MPSNARVSRFPVSAPFLFPRPRLPRQYGSATRGRSNFRRPALTMPRDSHPLPSNARVSRFPVSAPFLFPRPRLPRQYGSATRGRSNFRQPALTM